MATATAQLLAVLNEEESPPEGKDLPQFLYDWCAKYCVFRDTDGPNGVTRSVQEAKNLPLIQHGTSIKMVRQVYVDGVTTKIALANKFGTYIVVDFTGNETKFSVPPDTAFTKAFNATISGVRPVYAKPAFMKPLTVVLVDNPPWAGDDGVTHQPVGAGGIVHAPQPSYRIVGVVSQAATRPTKDSTEVTVMVYVRGEHFVPTPYEVKVPVMGYDKFYSASDTAYPAHTAAISAAVTTAYKNLDGLVTSKQENVTVLASGEVKLEGTANAFSSMQAFFAARVETALTTTMGDAYAKAINEPILYTYVQNPKEADLTNAIENLTKAHPQAKDTLEAANALRALLFGEEVVTPPPGDDLGIEEVDVSELVAAQVALRTAQASNEKLTRENLVTTDLAQTRMTEIVNLNAVVKATEEELTDAHLATARLGETNASIKAILSDTQASVREGVRNLENERRKVADLTTTNAALQVANEGLLEGGDVDAAARLERERLTEALRVSKEIENGLRITIAELTRELDVARDEGGGREPRVGVVGGDRQYKDLTSTAVQAMRAEVGHLARDIVALQKRLRRDPGDKDAGAELREKERRRDAKSDALFKLTR